MEKQIKKNLNSNTILFVKVSTIRMLPEIWQLIYKIMIKSEVIGVKLLEGRGNMLVCVHTQPATGRVARFSE